MSGLKDNPEGRLKLFRYYVVRYLGDQVDSGYRRLGPYSTKKKAETIAGRLTSTMRARRLLTPGEAYRVESVQYAGPGTLPENAG